MADKKRWYRVDAAGIIYSALQTDDYSAVYRFTAVMTDTVDIEALCRAADRTMPRFPALHVRIKRGAFWYYFEPDDRPGRALVMPDTASPCAPVRRREKGSRLVRLFYYQRRISVELFHALADGAGAMIFFRTLLAAYLRERGVAVPAGDGVLDLDAPPAREELEDANTRYATGVARLGRAEQTAYRPRGTAEPFFTVNLIAGLVPVDAVKAAARRYNASITEYLAAVLLHVLAEHQRFANPHRLRPVSLALPVNLRTWFPTGTLSNFILTIRPSIDPRLGEYTFPELVAQVHHYMRLNLNRQLLRARLTGMTSFQRNPFLRAVPCFIKDPILRFVYDIVGSRPYSLSFTNPGAFTVPPEMAPHIEHMEVTLGQPYKHRPNCAVISYGNTMTITFAATIKESELERAFFRFLVKDGIPVKIQSNRRE